MKKQFDFRGMSFYQIWIRSFADGNGDGIGDLYGVYDRLEYIRSLGVDGIWFSPIYPSPNADYGYDISDYRDINPEYGTLEQFKKVLSRAHELGLKVIMDLVINHTSDEHPWFKESRKGKGNPYSDYYIWRDPRWKGEEKLPPNNWYSQFEGLAWEYCPERKQYYLHVFAKKQPDLNMDNPKVREEVKGIMRFWLDMGVDGFREDVITYISKHEKLPDGIPFLPAINGLPFYKDGPNILKYLREFRKVALEYGAVQIGEAPMTPVKTALRYLTGKRPVLDMMIQFDSMMADCFLTEYVYHRFSLRKFKRACTRWQMGLAGKAWNALYLENHDHPRIINRYGSLKYWRESGTMLAACYIFMQGTPFIYQGQEIGMTNIALPSIEYYEDVASINAYYTFHRREPEEIRMRRIHAASRDSARTPVQWSDEKYAGFSTAKPWFFVNPNYRKINVRAEEKDPDSILNFYRKCLALRKSSPALLKGSYRLYAPLSGKIYMYERVFENDSVNGSESGSENGTVKERVLVVCSFSKKSVRYRLPQAYREGRAELILDNIPGAVSSICGAGKSEAASGKASGAGSSVCCAGKRVRLRPYEVQVYRLREG